MRRTPDIANVRRWGDHLGRGLLVLVAMAMITTATGCRPKFYRLQADNEVQRLVQNDVIDPESPLNQFGVYSNPTSRMFDPNPPDFEPMPPDDPRSHELMRWVDGKRGYKHWDRYGQTPFSENPDWAMYLCPVEDGTIPIDIRAAVGLSLNNSRLYQERLEQLYLAALDVSFERFRFDAQFFGGHQTFFTSDGPDRVGGARSELDLATRDIRMSKLYASGGELVVGLANRLMWQFSGNDTHSATTLLDFSLVQPLLKSRGRLRVLESLTDTERALLAQVRQMERFRRGFYADIVSGIDPDGITGGGVGIGAAQAGGFLGLLQDIQEIRNQQASVTGLRESLDQLEAANEAARIDRFQVELARQALYAAQSQLIGRKASYRSRLDSYKVELGLPPETPIEIDDPLLDRFNFLDPEMIEMQEDTADLLDHLRGRKEQPTDQEWDQYLQVTHELVERTRAHVLIVDQDMVALDEALPRRRENLRELASRVAEARSDIDADAYSPADLDARVERLKEDQQRFDIRAKALEAGLAEIQNPVQHAQLVEWLVKLSGELQELMLIQAGIRLDAVTLQPVKIDSYEALQVARCNRRDWRNERAALVDTWRQIQFTAADLASFLNVVFEGDISNTGDNPLRLRSTTGRLRVGAEFDAPLTRLAERNTYRAAQIAYQRARREYYAFVDLVSLGLRNTLRNAELRQVDFELRRAAVQVAISQVELTRLRLSEPPRAGETETFNSSTARDLVTAISSLLDAQNDFLGVWINYEVIRLGLDFNMGTMQLDPNGIWLDPGIISPENLPPCEYPVFEAPRAFEDPKFAVPANTDAARDTESIEPGRVVPPAPIPPQDQSLPGPVARAAAPLYPMPAGPPHLMPSPIVQPAAEPIESPEGPRHQAIPAHAPAAPPEQQDLPRIRLTGLSPSEIHASRGTQPAVYRTRPYEPPVHGAPSDYPVRPALAIPPSSPETGGSPAKPSTVAPIGWWPKISSPGYNGGWSPPSASPLRGPYPSDPAFSGSHASPPLYPKSNVPPLGHLDAFDGGYPGGPHRNPYRGGPDGLRDSNPWR